MHRLPPDAGMDRGAGHPAAKERGWHIFAVQDVWPGERKDQRGPNVRYGDAFTMCAGKRKAGVLYVDGVGMGGADGGGADGDDRMDRCILRLLTPLECERIQGLPDDHTRWGAGGEELSDTRRYNLVGRAVPPPAVAAIASRIPPGAAEGGA